MEAYLAKRPQLKENTKKAHQKRYNDMSVIYQNKNIKLY